MASIETTFSETTVRHLDPTELEMISNAIARAYNEGELKRLLRFNWGLELTDWFDIRQGFLFIVSDVVEFAEKKGKTLDLLRLAYSKSPTSPLLKECAAKFGILAAAPGGHASFPGRGGQTNLEAMVNSRSRRLGYIQFLDGMKKMARRICKIETPGKMGTGFLVGPDFVLTNYHVIMDIIDSSVARATTCRFDFTSDGGNLIADTEVGLADDWRISYSPFSNADVTGEGEPNVGELDYALIRLSKAVGEIEGPDGTRGWFALRRDTPIIALNDIVVIAQHAAGRPLEVAWGNVLSFPTSGERIRYDATTDAGASGSPCFSVDLELIGLHHASEPSDKPTFNQAVPLWRIADDLASKGVEWPS